MKLQTTLTLVIAVSAFSGATALSLSDPPEPIQCPTNCVQCQANAEKSICEACYKGYPDANTHQCDPVRFPGPCLVLESPTSCQFCAPGYLRIYTFGSSPAPKTAKIGDLNVCQKSRIANCMFGDVDVYQSSNKVNYICHACKGGYLSTDYSKCIPWTGAQVKFCDWGAESGVCFKCIDGYITSAEGRSCIKATKPAMEGCLQYEAIEDACLMCNFYDGYVRATTQTCKKATTVGQGKKMLN